MNKQQIESPVELKRRAARLALSLLVSLFIAKGSNTDRLPCLAWLNRFIDCLTVISEGVAFDE